MVMCTTWGRVTQGESFALLSSVMNTFSETVLLFLREFTRSIHVTVPHRVYVIVLPDISVFFHFHRAFLRISSTNDPSVGTPSVLNCPTITVGRNVIS